MTIYERSIHPVVLFCIFMLAMSSAFARKEAQNNSQQNSRQNTHVNASSSPVVNQIGAQFHYALMVAAANPDRKFKEGSIGERAQTLLGKLKPAQRRKLVSKSKAFVKQDQAAQMKIFTSKRNVNLRNVPDAQMWSMDATMEKIFKRDIKKRVVSYKPHVERALQELGGPVTASALHTQNALDGAIDTEMSLIYKREFNFDSPYKMTFKFRSNNKNIQKVYWELRIKANKYHAEKVLTSGIADVKPVFKSTHSYFKINLNNYWPAKQPIGGLPSYYVRAIPVGAQKMKPAKTVNRTFSSADKVQRGADSPDTTPDNSVGPWSNNVVINYTKADQGMTKFTARYNKAGFYLNKVNLFKKSSEDGQEEFSMRGFIKSHGKKCFFTDYVKLTVEGSSAFIDDKCFFNLPNQPDAYPRIFTVVMAGYEIDENGAVHELFDLIDDAYANDFLNNERRKEITDALKEQFRDDFEQYSEEIVKATLALVVSIMENDYYSELIKFLYVVISGAYEQVAPDDPYGPVIVTFALTSNLAEIADTKNVFYGQHNVGVDMRAGFIKPTSRKNGKITAHYKIPLVGIGVGAVGNFDGWYNIHSKWILTDKQ